MCIDASCLCHIAFANIPTETVEGWSDRFYKQFVEGNVWQGKNDFTKNVAIGNIESFIQSELDLALTKERTRVNEVLEGLKKPAESEKFMMMGHFTYNTALSDAQKRITEDV